MAHYLRFVILALVILSGWPGPAKAQDCLDCYETIYTTPILWRDALCCDPQSYWECTNLLSRGWWQVENWVGCNYQSVRNGTKCNGDSSCDDYWYPGGGGSSSCTINVGEACPPECERCQVVY